MDLEFWILVGTLGMALLVFGLGMTAHLPLSAQPCGPPALPIGPGLGGWRISDVIYRSFDLGIVGLLIFVYGSPLLIEAMGKLPDETPEIGMVAIVSTIAMQLFLTAMVVGSVAWRKSPVEWLGLRWRNWHALVLIAPVAVVVTLVFASILEIAGFNAWLLDLTKAEKTQEVVQAFGKTENPATFALLAFMAVVVAPVTEEILFRGYIYPVAKKFAGAVPAILFSSLSFAMVHHSAAALLPLCFLAVILAFAYEYTGSIWAPISIHMLFNGVTVAAQIAARIGWIELPEA